MRQPFIAGNWKMHLTREECEALAKGVAAGCANVKNVDVAVCPPAVYLYSVRQVIKGTPVALGAQNVYHEDPGAFTGEIAGQMLLDLGCKYVILGHSERRHILGETDEEVNRKVFKSLELGLKPIVCVGETLKEREAKKTDDIVRRQFHGSLAGLTEKQILQVVIAYEPVWAIGTGKVAEPPQAEAVHADLRNVLESRYNSQVAETVRIQYGGSVKPDNAAKLLGQPNIDGALVGGASLKVDDFVKIIEAAEA